MSLRKAVSLGLVLMLVDLATAADPPKPAAEDSRSLMRVVREGDDILAKFGVKAAKLAVPEGEFTIEGAKVTRVAKDGERAVVYATLRRASKPISAYYFRDEAEAIAKVEATAQTARLAFRSAGDYGAAKERAKLRREVDVAEYDEKTIKQAIRTAAEARKTYHEKLEIEVVVNKVHDTAIWSRKTELSGRVRVMEMAALGPREFDVMLPTSTAGIVKSEKRALELPPVIGRVKCEWVGDLK